MVGGMVGDGVDDAAGVAWRTPRSSAVC